MKRSVAIFFALLVLGTILVVAAWVLVYRVTPQHRRRQILLWLLPWSFKGLLVPAALWAILNFGVSFELQPLIPQIQFSQTTGGHWYLPFLRFVGFGFFIITSYWSALTLAWVLLRLGAGLEAEARSNFKGLCWTCLLGLFIPAGLVEVLGGWPTLGLAIFVLLAPIASAAPGLLQIKKMPPMYSAAIARIKFGKYAEAEWEIIRQLEACDDDFDGWLMLADLYANQFQDIHEAEQTILEICDQPKLTPSQLSIALHKLADWQVKFASDPDAARRALQVICDRLSGTHLARMAQLRISQLPATAEDLREQQSHKPIPLPALHEPLDGARSIFQQELDPQQAIELANACVGRLTRDPNDVSAREKLARLFAERLQEPERGLEQLNLLLNLPDQSDAKRVEWLALAAAWRLEYLNDQATGRNLLERLIREFPRTPQAFAARRRLQSLDLQDYRG